MTTHARLPDVGSKVELLVDLPDYNLVKGYVGSILVAYNPYEANAKKREFEVFFEKINMSVIVVEADFKLVD